MIKITGNTYPAQEMLKKAGFAWDRNAKAYFGSDGALTELKRTSTPTYSRKNEKLVAGLKFETINQ